MSCLREGSESQGGSEEAGVDGQRRGHGCHQHHPPHYDAAADHSRRHSSSHGHHRDAGAGGGGGGGEGSSGWVRSGRREGLGSVVGEVNSGLTHGQREVNSGGLAGAGSGTSVEVGGARRKVPQQVGDQHNGHDSNIIVVMVTRTSEDVGMLAQFILLASLCLLRVLWELLSVELILK